MPPKGIFLKCFLCIEVFLYGFFLYCDLADLPTLGTLLKYTALLGCLLTSLCSCVSRDSLLVASALSFTAAADLFLLVLNRWYICGVALFCVVQCLYARRLYLLDRSSFSMTGRVLFSGAAILLLAGTNLLDPLSALICLYFPQLVCNAIQSLYLPRCRSNYLFSIGLWLFVACDLCVGLYNSTLYFSSPLLSTFSSLVQIGMWLFYLPSQVCIVLSASRRSSL